MWTAPFDPAQRTLYVDVLLVGPAASRWCTFIIDTGTQITLLDPAIADVVGYGAHMGTRTSHLTAMGHAEVGYRLPVQRLELMGFTVERFEVACHEVAPELGIDGLVGMDLFEGRVVTIDGARGILSVA